MHDPMRSCIHKPDMRGIAYLGAAVATLAVALGHPARAQAQDGGIWRSDGCLYQYNTRVECRWFDSTRRVMVAQGANYTLYLLDGEWLTQPDFDARKATSALNGLGRALDSVGTGSETVLPQPSEPIVIIPESARPYVNSPFPPTGPIVVMPAPTLPHASSEANAQNLCLGNLNQLSEPVRRHCEDYMAWLNVQAGIQTQPDPPPLRPYRGPNERMESW